MSRLVSLTLALLLLSGCFALPFPVFPAAAQGQTAEITLSSFGGGPTYSVAVQDPEIVRCTFETTHNSDAPGAAVITVVTLTGCRAGTTTLTVQMDSPSDASPVVYTVTVDDDLHVTLTQARSLAALSFRRTSAIAHDAVDLVVLNGLPHLSIADGPYCPLAPEVLDTLTAMLGRHRADAWDGFDFSRPGVMDGTSFLFEAAFTDGTSIHARGSNAYPEGFAAFMEEFLPLLEELQDASAPFFGLDPAP